METKVICRAYGSGSFFGLEFTETNVDGLLVGVAHTADPELLARFDAHPAFEVVRPEPVAPAVGTSEHYATLHAPQAVEAIEAGVYSPEQALAFELLRDKPRSTVMAVLQPETGQKPEGGDDKQPDGDEGKQSDAVTLGSDSPETLTGDGTGEALQPITEGE